MKVLGLGPLEIAIIVVVVIAIVVGVMWYRKKGAGATQASKTRFCPKCGAELPISATFCAKCGNQLPASAVKQVPASQGASSSPFNPVSIASRACAIVAAIAMFMPWLEVPALASLKDYAAMAGVRISSETSYPMYNMGDVTNVLDRLSGSNAYSGIHMAFLFFWIIALVLLLVGLISSFVGRKSTGLLLVGGVVVALVAILWFAAITYLDGEYSRQVAQLIGGRVQFFEIPAAVWVAFVSGLASGVLGAAGKSKA